MLLVIPHVPKTAGTLIRDFVIGEGNQYPVMWLDLTRQTQDEFFKKCIDRFNSSDNLVVGGHFTLRDAARYMHHHLASDNCLIAGLIRDPFDRFCSHYEYHQRHKILTESHDILDELHGFDYASEPCLVGIYRSRLALSSRDTYGYYFGTGPYPDCDINGIFNSLLNYRLIFSSVSGLKSAVERSIAAMSSNSGCSIAPLLQLKSAIPLAGQVFVNSNPAGSEYSCRYADEFLNRRSMFASDYLLVNALRHAASAGVCEY